MAIKKRKVPHSKLKGLRAEKGLSMEDMAKILGMSRSSYIAKENAQRDFTFTEMYIIRNYFKVSAEDIFFVK